MRSAVPTEAHLGACPDDNDILAFVDGDADPTRRRAIADHARSCPHCRRLLDEADTGDPPELLETIARFIPLRRLGAGGMGIVYEAYDPELDRTIALKLLHPIDGDASSAKTRARLLKEARALARLSHRNVTTVHEIGEADGRVFLAMERIDGQNLRSWLATERRDWRSIVRIFVEAGRGLEAAHAAGLVHRDVKPDNLLIGVDGRVCVTDFGLVRIVDDPDTTIDRAAPGAARSAFAGTPAYMAPEQHLGHPVGPAADQFGLCAALYEAVYGVRPFAGEDIAQVREAVLHGPRPEPRDATVPRWLRTVIRRGLAGDPARRFPSMRELVAGLESRRTRAVRIAASLALVAVGAAAAWSATGGDEPDACTAGARRRLDAVWNAATRARLDVALTRSGKPYAAHAVQRTDQALGDYGQTWLRARVRACGLGPTPGAAASPQARCLEDRVVELEVAIAHLGDPANARAVETAVEVATGLSDIQLCFSAPEPTLELARLDAAARTELDRLRRELARARVLGSAGDYAGALTLAHTVSAAAARAPDLRLRAAARFLVARMKIAADRDGDVADDLYAAIELAERARDDHTVAEAQTLLIYDLAVTRNALDEATALAPIARATIARTGDDPSLLARWHQRASNLERRRGRLAEATAQMRQAIALYERAGRHDPSQVTAIDSLGQLLVDQGQFAEAHTAFERALAINEQLLGADHPDLASSLIGLANAARSNGKLDEAEQHLNRSLRITEAAFGPDHPDLAYALQSLGALWLYRLEPERAVPYYRRAVDVQVRAYGPDDRRVANASGNLGAGLLQLRRWAEAHDAYARALAIYERVMTPEHPTIAYAHLGIGESLVGLHRPADAIPHLETALPHAPRAKIRAAIQFALARALADAGRDRRRARQLALDARASFRAAEDTIPDEIENVDRWLAKHP